MTITPAFKLVTKYYTTAGVLDTVLALPVFLDPLAAGVEPTYSTADGVVNVYTEADEDLTCQGLPGGIAHIDLFDPQGYLLWSSSHGWVD